VKKGKKQLWEKYGYSFTFRDYWLHDRNIEAIIIIFLTQTVIC
jgi:hypothetical protein